LLYTSQKQIYKQVKQVKTFLLQKEIRSNNSKSKETKVNSIKGLDLTVVTQQAIRQLGLYHCDPRYKMITTVDEGEEEEKEDHEEENSNEEKTEEGCKGEEEGEKEDKADHGKEDGQEEEISDHG